MNARPKLDCGHDAAVGACGMDYCGVCRDWIGVADPYQSAEHTAAFIEYHRERRDRLAAARSRVGAPPETTR